MSSAQILIDSALKTCSAYRLHKLTGSSVSSIGQMAKGRRPVPPKVAGQVAALLELDPAKAALAAVVDQEKNQAKQLELAALWGLDPEPWLHSKASPP